MSKDAVNTEAVAHVARGLEHLADEVVFVGGSVISLYADDPGSEIPRPTWDVDLVVEINSYIKYAELEGRLSDLGFHHSPEDKIMCRFRYDGVQVDVMPTDVPELGPTNIWYVPGMKNAIEIALTNGQMIKVLSAPYFTGTKLEAFNNRGGDMRSSPDFEDIVFLLDSRLDLVTEISNAPNDIREYLKKNANELLENGLIREAIEAHLNPQVALERTDLLIQKLEDISNC